MANKDMKRRNTNINFEQLQLVRKVAQLNEKQLQENLKAVQIKRNLRSKIKKKNLSVSNHIRTEIEDNMPKGTSSLTIEVDFHNSLRGIRNIPGLLFFKWNYLKSSYEMPERVPEAIEIMMNLRELSMIIAQFNAVGNNQVKEWNLKKFSDRVNF